MELIEKQKLLEWLNRNIDANQLSQGGIALKILRESVESGTFDDHSTQDEISKLKKELNISELAHEQAERDFEKWKAKAMQAESDKRDAMMSLLKGDRLIEKLWEDLGQAEQERNALLEGLKWYADGKNWGSIEDLGAMVSDGGDHARSIISKIEGNTSQ